MCLKVIEDLPFNLVFRHNYIGVLVWYHVHRADREADLLFLLQRTVFHFTMQCFKLLVCLIFKQQLEREGLSYLILCPFSILYIELV